MAGVRTGREYMERDNEGSFVIKNGGTSGPAEGLTPVLYTPANIR
jgi:hypothetical protein